MRAHLTALALGCVCACSPSTDRTRESIADAAEPEIATDAETSAPSADAAHAADASAEDGNAAATLLDAGSALDASGDASEGPSDAGSISPADARLSEYDATPPPCTFAPDAGFADYPLPDATIAFECTGFVCSADGGTYLALTHKHPWYVGGLNWAGSLCRRPLGWASDMTADLRYIFFPWQAREALELAAGQPLFVYWAGPHDEPNERAVRCSVAPRQEPLPVCPTLAK